jgi:hypothetical protein
LRGLLVVEPQAVVGVHSLQREYAASVGGLFAFGLRSTFSSHEAKEVCSCPFGDGS